MFGRKSKQDLEHCMHIAPYVSREFFADAPEFFDGILVFHGRWRHGQRPADCNPGVPCSCSFRAFPSLGGSVRYAPKSPNQCFLARRYIQCLSGTSSPGSHWLKRGVIASSSAIAVPRTVVSRAPCFTTSCFTRSGRSSITQPRVWWALSSRKSLRKALSRIVAK